MAKSKLMESLSEALADVRLIDTHEHLVPERYRLDLTLDFTYLLPHYLSSDLVSAGMPPHDLEVIRAPGRKMREGLRARINPRDAAYLFSDLLPEDEPSVEEKWRVFRPFWEKTRNTGYARGILVAIRDLFGLEDLNGETYEQLSEALRRSNRPGWYRHVLKERAGIDICVHDFMSTGEDRELYAPAIRFDRFVDVRDPADVQRLERDTATPIRSVDDLVRAMQADMARKADEGMVAVKSGLAYQRIIHYGEATHHEAEQAFNRLFRHPQERMPWEETKPLQDYMMHQVIRQAIEHRRPIQIHTGLQEGNANVITNSHPAHLVNLFLRYPQARFDIFHASYPYHSELAALAKNFANVYADMCWVYIISPSMAAGILHEWLETIPASKILGFGGDYIIPEGSYGHAVMARQVILQVLAQKVESGYFTEPEAVTFGRMILRDNAKELFGL